MPFLETTSAPQAAYAVPLKLCGNPGFPHIDERIKRLFLCEVLAPKMVSQDALALQREPTRLRVERDIDCHLRFHIAQARTKHAIETIPAPRCSEVLVDILRVQVI